MKYCIVFTNEFSTLSPMLSNFNFESDPNLLKDVKSLHRHSALPIENIVLLFFKYSIQALTYALKEIEKEVKVLHSLSFSITTKNRIDYMNRIGNCKAFCVYIDNFLKIKKGYIEIISQSKQFNVYNRISKEHITRLTAQIQHYKIKLKFLDELLQLSAETYSHVIEQGVFDYSINISDLMRVYATFNSVFAIPNLLTSLYGMNVPVPLQMDNWDSLVPFGIILGITVLNIIVMAIYMKFKVSKLK